MNRDIIPENQIIVALDTNIFRQLCYNTFNWVGTFEKMAKNGYHFCFTDVALAELINQHERGSICGKQWENCLNQTSRFISKELPVLPGKKHLFNMAGIQYKNDNNDFDSEFIKEYSQALWEYFLSESNSFYYNGVEYSIKAELNKAEEELEKERSKWIDLVDVFINDDKPFKFSPKSMDDETISSPALSIKLDLYYKYICDVSIRCKQSKDSYNPKAKKKKNDGIDFLLTHVLALPALLCTVDDKFYNTLKALDSYQTNWIYKPDELALSWLSKTVNKPEWSKNE